MTIPSSTLYPTALDSNTNLFEVHDSLRMKLAEDYNPGDTSIIVETDIVTSAIMPQTGLITLTEQCSDVDLRAISFFYTAWDSTNNIISGLELLPTFTDNIKPKRITNVTVNVMSMHHNHIKDALKSIQKFCGVKGTIDNQPFGETLEGRINFLRKIVLQPKSWFTSDKRNGNVPLEIEFKNMSFRLGTDGTEDNVTITWDFGDHTTSSISLTSIISADSVVPMSAIETLVRDTDGGTIRKTYYKPGIYDVKLTVQNKFGKDECFFQNYINARVKAPKEAIIDFVENISVQSTTPGDPSNEYPEVGHPFVTNPKIRSPINTLIQIEIADGEYKIDSIPTGYSFSGEVLDENKNPVDPVSNYTWYLGDDLNHPNSKNTSASYSVGGIYDVKLRVDTSFGAYRITSYANSIDVVENKNMWVWVYQSGNLVRAYEYGLISETFKLIDVPTLNVTKNEGFINNYPTEEVKSLALKEFRRNTGFAPRSNISSGQSGTSLLYWASGRGQLDPASSEKINVVEFDGFTNTYIDNTNVVNLARPWNWVNLNSPNSSYFIFGTIPAYDPSSSYVNETKTSLNLNSLTSTNYEMQLSNYLNGAQELRENVSTYDNFGNSNSGHFSIHRSVWKDNTGFLLRNDGVGPFFRIKSFYRTEGTLSSSFINIRKLQDLQGPTKLEGQLTDLSTGIYFLNNSGSVSKFTPDTNSWSTGGPGVNSLLYRSLQDTSVIGYDDNANTLLVGTDSDKRAYLSFDYSPNAFVRFSEIDLTFVTLGSRPSGNQWIIGVY
jgi:PKD repeat protein